MHLYRKISECALACILLGIICIECHAQVNSAEDTKLFSRHRIDLFGSGAYSHFIPSTEDVIKSPVGWAGRIGLSWGRKCHEFEFFGGYQERRTQLDYSLSNSSFEATAVITRKDIHIGLGYSLRLAIKGASEYSFRTSVRREQRSVVNRELHYGASTKFDGDFLKKPGVLNIGLYWRREIFRTTKLSVGIFGEYYIETTGGPIFEDIPWFYYAERLALGSELIIYFNIKK